MKPILASIALLVLAACASKNIQTKEAVREAVVDYLTATKEKTGLVMDAMNVEVMNMSFQADTAQVTVAVNVKTGGAGMQIGYDLERKGDKWAVKRRTSLDIMNGASPDMPPGHPATGAMPAGHPPVGAK